MADTETAVLIGANAGDSSRLGISIPDHICAAIRVIVAEAERDLGLVPQEEWGVIEAEAIRRNIVGLLAKCAEVCTVGDSPDCDVEA